MESSEPVIARKPVVLAIDDEDDMRDMLGLLLPLRGYEVEAVSGGRQAIERVKVRAFDVAITDLRMPDMDGFATVAALKQVAPNLPVVITSGYAPYETLQETLRRGASAYVRKPFELDELVATLRRVLGDNARAR